MLFKQLTIFALYYLALALGLRLIGGLEWDRPELKSALFGSGLSGFLFVFSYLGWSGIFAKKFVALSAMIIVFKYAILVLIVYVFANQTWSSVGWFVGGMVTFKAPLFLWAIFLSRKNKTKSIEVNNVEVND